jgi:hypothetical protein
MPGLKQCGGALQTQVPLPMRGSAQVPRSGQAAGSGGQGALTRIGSDPGAQAGQRRPQLGSPLKKQRRGSSPGAVRFHEGAAEEEGRMPRVVFKAAEAAER